MTPQFLRTLLDEASAPFLKYGKFAYHFARGKLGGDPIFREILRAGLLPQNGRLLDLGCGQGSLFGWLLAAQNLHQRGLWPADWHVPPPNFSSLHGIELMQSDVNRANAAFGAQHAVIRVEQGDMTLADFPQADAITILDALHYFDYEQQSKVLKRIKAALLPGGVFLTRIGDASAGWPFYFSNAVDHVVTFIRGHRLPRLYCRSLDQWTQLLNETGFVVTSHPMSQGKPFANIMLVCTAKR